MQMTIISNRPCSFTDPGRTKGWDFTPHTACMILLLKGNCNFTSFFCHQHYYCCYKQKAWAIGDYCHSSSYTV